MQQRRLKQLRPNGIKWNLFLYRVVAEAVPAKCLGSALPTLCSVQAIATRHALANLPLKACFSSPISRAMEFAELIWGDRDPPITYDDTLREAYLGYMQGMKNSDAADQHPAVYGTRSELFVRKALKCRCLRA